jgi:cell division protease FtsH
VCTGAVSDLQRATAIARDMVTKYGMSEKLGHVTFTSGSDEVFIGRSMAQAKPYSEETAALIDSEVKALLDDAYARCREILTRDRDKLETVARFLLAHETMDAGQFRLAYDDPAALTAETEEG